MAKITTSNYDAVNALKNKEPILVVEIDGLPYVFATNVTYSQIKYDDPGIYYDGAYVYDGLKAQGPDKVKTWIDRQNTKSTISQKLEQWDGRASVETFNFAVIDKNGQITQLLAPGLVLPEIINRKVRVYFGYKLLSFPQDFTRIFTGYVNNYKIVQGKVFFDLTDPSSLRKQVLFNGSKSKLTADVTPTDTTMHFTSTDNFYRTITNAKLVSDPTVTIGLRIGNEIMFYNNTNIASTTQINSIQRGKFNTVGEAHKVDDEVECFIMFDDNPINIALKLMLSGWGTEYTSGIQIRAINNTDGFGIVPDSITFGENVELKRDYGLSVGDFVTMSGFTVPANNGVFTIKEFTNNNRTAVFAETGILVQENPLPSGYITGSVAFRSKYDVYPISAGLGMTPDDVFVERHEEIRDTFITFTFQLPVIGSESSGKTYIESNIMKVIGAYTLTQGSRISMGLTHPPLASDFTHTFDNDNVVDAKSITVQRGLNFRFFYNEIFYNYGWDPINNTYSNSLRVIDADAQNRLQQVSVLQVDCQGLPDNGASQTILQQRAQRLLLRYRYAAETISLTTFFGVGHTIDAGDIAILTDRLTNGNENPQLQISNTETGQRGIYNRIMEVQERTVDLSTGKCSITLLSNNGFSVTDKYAVIGPSSLVSVAVSSSRFKIEDSFLAKYPGQEWLKWQAYDGSRIRVFRPDYSVFGEAIFHLDKSNPLYIDLETPLSFAPQPGDVMQFANFDETSQASQSLVKSSYAFINKTGHIVSGSSANVFTLASGEGSKYRTGNIVYIQDQTGDIRMSPDLRITLIVGDVLTVGAVDIGSAADLGFTPVAGDLVKLGGYLDGSGSYRLL